MSTLSAPGRGLPAIELNRVGQHFLKAVPDGLATMRDFEGIVSCSCFAPFYIAYAIQNELDEEVQCLSQARRKSDPLAAIKCAQERSEHSPYA